jgi:poly(beta-D-mannuronate) lyase
MVFRCPNSGSTTSDKTKYPRSELREMIRGTNDDIDTKGVNGNNWVLSTSSSTSVRNAGGSDGRLSATLSVDHVSKSGDASMIGRVVVGQIHGSEDEPLKLYYRKLPGNSIGSVYFAYEKWQGSDVKYHLIGGSGNNDSNPSNGIALGEKWSYEVDVYGRDMTVTVTKEDGSVFDETITMESDYNNDWMYFKAGVYNQNNGGDAGDYVQATFYKLTQSHD